MQHCMCQTEYPSPTKSAIYFPCLWLSRDTYEHRSSAQSAHAPVDAEHHLIVAHEVANVGNDRTQLSKMAKSAHDVMGASKLHVFADRGYFNGPEIKACEDAGIMSVVPRLAEAAFTWHAVKQEVGNSKYQLPEAIDPI